MDLHLGKEVSTAAGFLGGRRKSANRMRYDAEIRVIKARFGELEEIRSKLGLSRRKICQLLLVDPSAWSRWTLSGAEPPPHIYRALEWYILLTEKDPRALMPIGTWSSTAFEDRIQLLESRLEGVSKARAGMMGAVLLVGLALGALTVIFLRPILG